MKLYISWNAQVLVAPLQVAALWRYGSDYDRLTRFQNLFTVRLS